MKHIGFICKYFVAIENELPVNDWVHEGVHLWPLIRIHLYICLSARAHAHIDELEMGWITPNHPWARFMDAAASRVGELPPPPVAAFPPDCAPSAEINPAAGRALERGVAETSFPSATGAPLLFLCDDHYHSATAANGAFEPVMDPWIDLFRPLAPVLKIEIGSGDISRRAPRHHPGLVMAPWTMDTVRRRGMADAVDVFINRFADACALVVRHTRDHYGFDIGALTTPGARRFAYLTITRRLMMDEFLDAVSFRAVIFQNYYDPQTMGAIWSANARGLTTVDVQHGTNGDFHGAYTHWTAVPDRGYVVLPDAFLVWDAQSACNVETWLRRPDGRHRAIIGGRATAQNWGVENQDALVALAAQAKAAARTILVSLSPQLGMAHGVPEALLETMRRAPDDWIWFVRCHPTAPADGPFGPDGITGALTAAGLSGFDCHGPSRVPLAPLIALCDHHVTQLSSCFLDCLAAGTPTTFIHPISRQQFGGHIARGLAHFAVDPDAILDTLRRGAAGLAPSPLAPRADPARAAGALAAIINPSCQERLRDE